MRTSIRISINFAVLLLLATSLLAQNAMFFGSNVSSGAAFTPAFQTGSNCHGGGTSCTATIAVTAGWFAVCIVADTTVSTPFTCADTNADSFSSPTSSPFLGTVTNAGLFFARLNTTNATEVFTCGVSNSNGFMSCVVGVYTGTPTSGWDVALAGANNTTTTSFTSGTTTVTTAANELGVGGMIATNSTAQTITGTNGWTFRQQEPGPGMVALLDKVLTVTGAQTMTATTNFSESGIGIVSTIK